MKSRSYSIVRKARTAAAPAPPVEEISGGEQDNRNVVTDYRWAWYALALLVPFAGMFIAIFIYDQDSREVRKVGRNCLIISFLIWVVFPVFITLSILFMTLLVGFQLISDALPAMD
jgi:hypothetical protein